MLTQDPNNNVTEYIYSKMGINLHHQPDHPIGIIKQVSSCVSWIDWDIIGQDCSGHFAGGGHLHCASHVCTSVREQYY